MMGNYSFLSVFSIFYYILVSFLLNVTNSLVFQGGFRSPCLLLVGQLSLFTLLYFLAVIFGFVPPKKKYLFMTNRLLLLIVFFFVMNLSNMAALSLLNDIVVFIGIRRTTCFFVLLVEWLFQKKKPTCLVFCSVFCITLGALWSLLFHSQPFHWRGLSLVILGNLSSACYLVWIPFASEGGHYSTFQLTVSLSCWSLPGMSLIAMWFPAPSQQETAVLSWIAFGFSCVLGCFISHATYMNSMHNSALTHSVSGHIKDILGIAIGSWIGIGSFPKTLKEQMGWLLNILGGFLYIYAKYKGSKKSSTGEEIKRMSPLSEHTVIDTKKLYPLQ